MLLGDDEAEQPQIAQALNEFGRLFRRAVPLLEILMPGREVLVDGIEHHSQDFAVFGAQPRIREELLFENSPRHQILCDAHHLLRNAIDQKIEHPVAAHFVGQFAVQIAGRGMGWPLKDTRAVIETRCPLLRTRPGIMESAGDSWT